MSSNNAGSNDESTDYKWPTAFGLVVTNLSKEKFSFFKNLNEMYQRKEISASFGVLGEYLMLRDGFLLVA